MLKELSRAGWLAALDLTEDEVPSVLILCGTRNPQRQLDAVRPYLTRARKLSARSRIIEHACVGSVSGHWMGFACVYGAAAASEMVHIFGTLGTRAVLHMGECSALSEAAAPGDLFSPEWAFCGDGASAYYCPDRNWASASAPPVWSDSLVPGSQAMPRAGVAYTTAARFAEQVDDADRWFRHGFDCVDLETATVYTVAEYFDMARLSLLCTTHTPRRLEYLLPSAHETELLLAEANRHLLHLGFTMAVELANDGAFHGRVARPTVFAAQP